jgi:hypothetical protein
MSTQWFVPVQGPGWASTEAAIIVPALTPITSIMAGTIAGCFFIVWPSCP